MGVNEDHDLPKAIFYLLKGTIGLRVWCLQGPPLTKNPETRDPTGSCEGCLGGNVDP